ncbi:very long chain fatty acid elongase 4-like [Ornithodoros turicata]|uniref:very long chain fatty acid elongase 4-like n=1 Tax=Ornithodoros turicata TaxID=34597 RepID=UPI0031396960
MHLSLQGTLETLSKSRDPRTAGWLLTGNPAVTVTIICLYICFVKYWGPEWMRDRKPFQLTALIRAYNLTMIGLHAFFAAFFFGNTYLVGNYSWFCTGIDFKPTPQSMKLLNGCWFYFFVRIGEFLDTVFFVLRKKNTHVSVLHIVHHSIIVWNGWLGLTFGAEGQVMLAICINSLVHVIMYGYYFLASFGPAVAKYLWWKKYLTQLQIGQLTFFVMYAMIPMFYDCGYPKVMTYIGLVEAVIILALFCNFYLSAYTKRRRVLKTA